MSTTRPVTKQIFLTARQCMTKAWFDRNGSARVEPLSESDQFLVEQGIAIGKLARSLYADGKYIFEGSNEASAEKTRQLMADARMTTLFEATFCTAGYVAKADIIRREQSGWHLYEVKMNLADTDKLADLIDDLSYTVMVARRCGVKVIASSLMLLSRDYRKGMGADRLFVTSDQTAKVERRLADFEMVWDATEAMTAGRDQPKPTLCGHCRECDYFDTACLGMGIAHPVVALPAIQAEKLLELGKLGVIGIEGLPDDFDLTEMQRRVCDCARSKKPFVGETLTSEFAAVQWPAYYLDFETVMTALPLYDGLAPYSQIATQFSIHKCSGPGNVEGHFEYLAEPTRNCERELAERLIDVLGNEGTIIVYSSFEQTRIREMAERYVDLAEPLLGLVGRLFDLLSVVRSGYYHPNFYGSFSIKRTLPALVPEMTYAGLNIADGGTAIARFATMAMGQLPADEANRVRDDLLCYCRHDTLAMVKLHESLLRCSATPSS